MNIDLNKKYFLMSFRFDKSKPNDFGLVQSKQDDNIFIDISDNSQWIRHESYDFGWGNENGFMRLPKLVFEELWYLLTNSKVQENKYGSASLIEQEYANELLTYLMDLFEQKNNYISDEEREAFKILNLDIASNRSSILGKSLNEIEEEYEKWKFVSKMVKAF